MPKAKTLKEECDFCGRRAVSLTAACGFHKICVRCNIKKRATSSCSFCFGRTDPNDDNSDLTGNNDEWEAILQPVKNKKPSWLTPMPKLSKRSTRLGTNMQILLPKFEATPTTSRVQPSSPPAPENSTTTSSEADLSSDNMEVIEEVPLPGQSKSSTRSHRKPRRLQALNASKIQPKLADESAAEVISTVVSDPGPSRDSGSVASVDDEEHHVHSWRAKTPGAIMFSELRGIPTMYDQSLPRTKPWEFQSFANLGERCAIMWREQTGHSPPGDDSEQLVIGQGDVTRPDSEFELGYMELEPSDDGTFDYEDSINSSPLSERENNSSPCKGQRVTYDRSWVVHDRSNKEKTSDEDDPCSELEEIEGPGFHSDVELEEEEDDFWETNDRIVRKGYMA